MEEKKRRGRPKKDDARNIPKKVMFNKEEDMELRRLSIRSGLSQTEIMRIGISNFMNQLGQAYPVDEYDDWGLDFYEDSEDIYDDF